jgi:hypothetical protein
MTRRGRLTVLLGKEKLAVNLILTTSNFLFHWWRKTLDQGWIRFKSPFDPIIAW